MVNYLELALGLSREVQEKETEDFLFGSGFQPTVKSERSDKNEAEYASDGINLPSHHNRTMQAPSELLMNTAIKSEGPVWRIQGERLKRPEGVTAGWTGAERIVGSQDADQAKDAAFEQPGALDGLWLNQEEKTEINRDLHWLALKGTLGKRMGENMGMNPGMLRFWRHDAEKSGKEGGAVPPSDFAVRSAETVYQRLTSLGHTADYRKQPGAVAMPESGTGRNEIEPEALDRAFQRDARRYSGGFSLF